MIKIRVHDRVRGESIAQQKDQFSQWVLDPPNENARYLLEIYSAQIAVPGEFVISPEVYRQELKQILQNLEEKDIQFEWIDE